MPLSRKISRVVTVPPIGPGFAGPAHNSAAVIPPGDFEATDPFFLMMDDRISVAGQFGGEHPHAGLETVTFILSGTMEDLGGKLLEGDVEWMTAGRGIIHAEKAVVSEGMRLLQLWVVLPENQRHIAPRVQLLARDRMPVRQEPGVEARLYSGRSGGLEAATTNQVPMTLLDIRLQSGASFGQELPSSYNGFLFVLEGALTRWRSIGGDRRGSSGLVGSGLESRRQHPQHPLRHGRHSSPALRRCASEHHPRIARPLHCGVGGRAIPIFCRVSSRRVCSGERHADTALTRGARWMQLWVRLSAGYAGVSGLVSFEGASA